MSGTINFNSIPVGQLRVPGTNIEIDPLGGTGTQLFTVLVIGQMTAAGNAVPNFPVQCAGSADALAKGGAGSMLALMAQRYIAQDGFGPLWMLPLQDDPAAVAATLAFVIGSTITANGTLALRIAGILIPVLVTNGMSAAQVAAAIVATIAENPNLPVTAAATSGVAGGVTLTAINKGLAGNDIDVRVNYYGTAGGETTPAGLTATGITLNGIGMQLSGGTQNPNLLASISNLADQKFNIIVQPYNDATSRQQFQQLMQATGNGRWSWSQMIYGHGIGAYRSTFAGLTTFGTSQNDPAMSTVGAFALPEPSWLVATDIAANVAQSVRVNPAQPLHDIPLGILPPPRASRFIYGQDNNLLFDGISTLKVDQGGNVFIQQMITEYQTNSQGSPDTSYLYANTRFQLDYVCTDLKNFINTTFIATRKILVSDATKVSVFAGGPIVTPSIVKAAVIARYYYLQSLGIVQNGDAFAAAVQVQQVAPGVLGIEWPGDLAEQLNNVAIQVAFTQS